MSEFVFVGDMDHLRLLNDTAEPDDASSETYDEDRQDAIECSTQHDASLCSDESFVHVDVECDLLSSAPRPQSHPAYKPLDDDYIRLLRILSLSSAANGIRCHIDEFPLHNAPAYTALSYTWGSQQGIHQIHVNDYPLLVPKNLWRFLNHARNLAKDLSRWIWCDMLSINQVDVTERGQQVQLMSRIFKTAQTVVVWLGPAYRGSDTAMTALVRLSCSKDFAKQASGIWAGDAGHAMGAICTRPYWRRLWIFQEIRLAQKIRLMCGSKIAPWKNFHDLMEHAHTKSGISQLDDNTEVIANSPAMRMRDLNLESVNTVLWSLIQETRHLRCFDIRDKIYALLGVATKGHGSIEPDYSVPIPTLLNKLLHEIWEEKPPTDIEDAAKMCDKIADVFGVARRTVFIMDGQRGRYNAPSDIETCSRFLGPECRGITLWWTAFYGHRSVQRILRTSWTISYFDCCDEDYLSSTTMPVVLLFQFLREGMDHQSSFLAQSLQKRDPWSPWSPRPDSQYEAEDSEARDSDASMTWVAFYLTGAINLHDSHIARLMVDIGVELGLLYPQYRPLATLIEATSGVLVDCTIGSEDYRMLEEFFARAGPFISETDHFVAHMLDHGRIQDRCGLLLDLGLMNMVQSDHRATLLDTALSKALMNENDEAVDALLRTGECNPNCRVYRSPALSYCIQTSQMSNLRALLETGKCDLDIVDPSSGMTPLVHAAYTGMHEYLKVFVETGACQLEDVNALGGMTPFFYAVSEGQTDTVRELLADGRCNVDTPHRLGQTALMMAVAARAESTVDLLLTFSHGAVNFTDDFGNTALGLASAEGLHRVVRSLLKVPTCNANIRDLSGDTPLILAVRRGHDEVVKELLACENCDVNASDNDGNTALLTAVARADGRVVRQMLLVERSALNDYQEYLDSLDDSQKDYIGGNEAQRIAIGRVHIKDSRESLDTKLVRARQAENYSLVSELLACGRCDVSISADDTTPLMLAAAYEPDGHPVLNALLDTGGCDVNAENSLGQTALCIAGYNENHWHAASLLMTGKCNIDKQSQKGRRTTLLHMAIRNRSKAFLQQLLREDGIDLCARDQKGQTPLIWAAKNWYWDEVKQLLAYRTRCGVDMRSDRGSTALSYAVSARDFEMVSLLVDTGRASDLTDEFGQQLYLRARAMHARGIDYVLTECAEKFRISDFFDCERASPYW